MARQKGQSIYHKKIGKGLSRQLFGAGGQTPASNHRGFLGG